MEQDHKRHFYCAMKAYTKQAISKISIISIKNGHTILCVLPLTECFGLQLSGNVCPFFIVIIVIIEILRTTIPLMKLL